MKWYTVILGYNDIVFILAQSCENKVSVKLHIRGPYKYGCTKKCRNVQLVPGSICVKTCMTKNHIAWQENKIVYLKVFKAIYL